MPIAVRERVAQIPPHAQSDDVRWEMTPLEGVFGVHERGYNDSRQKWTALITTTIRGC